MNVEGYLVTPRVLDALATRLRREPATASMLEDLATTFDVPLWVRMRVVDRWLQQNRKAGLIHFRAREWHWGASAAPAGAP
jgi:hypothetical protein